MRVNFPNGVVMDGVPDDATEQDILRELKRVDPETYTVALNALGKKGPQSPGFAGTVPLRIPGTDIGTDIPVPQGIEAAMLGAGRSADRLWAGAKAMFNPEDAQAIKAEQAQRSAAFAPIEEAAPVASAIGSALPAFAIPMGAVGGAAGGLLKAVPGMARAGKAIAASPVADAALTGGLLGGMDIEGSAGWGAAGGLAGGLLGKGVAGALRPVTSRATGSQTRAVDLARRSGFNVTPSQVTGSPGLTRVEASLRSNPFSAGAFRALDSSNQATVNRMAAKGIGESAESVTDDILDTAAKRIGSEFERIGRKAGNVNVDDTLMGKVVGTMDAYYDDLPEANRLLKLFEAGKLSGRDLMAESSKLGKRARSLMRSQPDRGIAVFELKDALDDAVMRATKGQEKRALAKARRQWRNLLYLTEPGVIRDPTKGDVSAATLGNVLRRKDKLGFMRGKGRGPLEDAARIGKAFPTPPDSWTASRLGLPLAVGSGGFLAGQQIQEGDYGDAALYGLAPIAAMGLAGRGYMSPAMRRYLEKGVPLLGRDAVRGPIGGLIGRTGAAAGLLAPKTAS